MDLLGGGMQPQVPAMGGANDLLGGLGVAPVQQQPMGMGGLDLLGSAPVSQPAPVASDPFGGDLLGGGGS